MELELDNVYQVFIFIILCSAYVCSILWLYGDMATRGMAGIRGAITAGLIAVPGFFAIPVFVANPGLIGVVLWPISVLIWISERPAEQQLEHDE